MSLKFPSSPAAGDDEKTANIYKPKPVIEVNLVLYVLR